MRFTSVLPNLRPKDHPGLVHRDVAVHLEIEKLTMSKRVQDALVESFNWKFHWECRPTWARVL